MFSRPSKSFTSAQHSAATQRTKYGYRPTCSRKHTERADILLGEGGLDSGDEEASSAGYGGRFDGRTNGILGPVVFALRDPAGYFARYSAVCVVHCGEAPVKAR